MDDAKMFIDRRAYPRFEVNFPVQYSLVEDKNDIQAILEMAKKDTIALVRDISLGGMKIDLGHPAKLGDILAFEIPLPGGAESISACAEVVWADGNIGGLHFLLLSDDDLTILKAYLKRLGFRS